MAPEPDLLLEDRWSFLRVWPVSEAGRRWVEATLAAGLVVRVAELA